VHLAAEGERAKERPRRRVDRPVVERVPGDAVGRDLAALLVRAGLVERGEEVAVLVGAVFGFANIALAICAKASVPES
jgi:hypothetical protein